MAGYCGKCNRHYNEHYSVHDEECEGETKGIVSGSVEDFEQQCGNYPDDVQEQIWNENFM